MPVMKYKTVVDDMLKKPVFGVEDLRNSGLSKPYSKKLLYMLEKSGKVKRIERGKYTCLDDQIVVAAYITQPCYLSLWTAMSIRNLTDQIPFSVEVVTPRKRFNKKTNFAGTDIVFHYTNPNMMFGYENIVWGNYRVPVAKTEKIIIDGMVFGLPKDDLIKLVKSSDIQLLEKYAKLIENEKIREKITELVKKCSRRKK